VVKPCRTIINVSKYIGVRVRVRSQESGVRSQELGVRSQELGVRPLGTVLELASRSSVLSEKARRQKARGRNSLTLFRFTSSKSNFAERRVTCWALIRVPSDMFWAPRDVHDQEIIMKAFLLR